jgi:hypothetical protein
VVGGGVEVVVVLVVVVVGALLPWPWFRDFFVVVVTPFGPDGPVVALGRGTLVAVVPLPQPAKQTQNRDRASADASPILRRASRSLRVRPGFRPLTVLRRARAGGDRNTGSR